MPNKALYLTAITLRSIAAGELYRSAKKDHDEESSLTSIAR